MTSRLTHVGFVGFQARVLQDAMSAAMPNYWDRRAAVWEWARPRRDDYNGRATRHELLDRDVRCRDIAAACRAKALVLRMSEPVVSLEVADLLEVA